MPAPNPYPALVTLRDKLATLPGVSTCRIGLEVNMTAADYPMIRIVPSLFRRGEKTTQSLSILIYYGEKAHDFEPGGIEAQYEWLFDMERQVKDAVISSGVRALWQDTALDEDRLPGYKIFASRFTLELFRVAG